MYPGVTNKWARIALTGLDILTGVAMAAIASFSIYLWVRALIRSFQGQSIQRAFAVDTSSNHKVDKVA